MTKNIYMRKHYAAYLFQIELFIEVTYHTDTLTTVVVAEGLTD